MKRKENKLIEIKKYQDNHIVNLNEVKLDEVIYANLDESDLLEDVLNTIDASE